MAVQPPLRLAGLRSYDPFQKPGPFLSLLRPGIMPEQTLLNGCSTAAQLSSGDGSQFLQSPVQAALEVTFIEVISLFSQDRIYARHFARQDSPAAQGVFKYFRRKVIVVAGPEGSRVHEHRSEEHTSELQSRRYLVCSSL